jgi:DNA-binding XRE family transcriptional regulator
MPRSDTARSATPGGVLRDLRISAGLNQTTLAVEAGVSLNTISFAERDLRVPNELTQEKIARALGVHRRTIWPRRAA